MKNFLKFIQDAVENVKEEAGKALENAQDLSQDLTATFQKQVEEAQKQMEEVQRQIMEAQANAQNPSAENENNGGLGNMFKGFLGSLEGFGNENNDQNNNQNSNQNSNQNNNTTAQTPVQVIEEEPINEVGHTFTIKTQEGEKTFQIAAHAELMATEDEGYQVTKHFLTTNKDHYIIHRVVLHHAVKAVMKTVIAKNQISNRATVSKKELSNENYLYTIYFDLKTKASMQVQWENQEANNNEITTFSVCTNTYEKVNEIQSMFLDADLSSGRMNTFVFIAGDGEIIKTDETVWFYEKGAAFYFETLNNDPREHRLLCVENNETSCTLKATHIPVDAVGDYTKIVVEYGKLGIPLTQSVYKTVYKDLEKPQAEEIIGNFEIFASHINADKMDYFLLVLGRHLPKEFWTEFRNPTIAYYRNIEGEVEEERLNREANNSYATNSSKSSKRDEDEEDEDKKDNKNEKSSSSSKPLYDIKIKNDFDKPVTVYNKNRGGSYRIMPRTTNTIKCYEGNKLFHKETNKLLFVVDSSMDGNVQLISKL